MEFHEYANIFPLMEGKELDELVSSIKKNGLRHPIVTFQGKILDGRNRYIACNEAKFILNDSHFTEWTGEEENLLDFVYDENSVRRQMTESQKAMVGARIANLQKGGDAGVSKTNRPDGPLVSQVEAAKMTGSSPTSIKRAKTVIGKGVPELVQAVDNGIVTVNTASKIAQLPKAEQEQIVREGDVKKIREKAKDIKKGRTVEKAKEEPKPSKKKEVKQQDNKYGVPFPQDCVRLTISDRKSSGIFCIAIEKPFEEVKEIVKSMFKKECERYA